MAKRSVVVGGAAGVAALVLGASIFLGPPAGSGDRVTDDGPDIGAATPTGPINDGGTGMPGGRAEDWTYTAIETVDDDKTRITLFGADSAQTRAQGITHLVKPTFQIVTTTYADLPNGSRVAIAGRAMTLTADAADMEMDGNEPQRGVFQGNVRVTLLATDGKGVVLDEADPRFGIDTDIQRVFIDGDARFGLDTNDIRSDAPVHVTSPQADFFGVGLLLKYNPARERIEQLVIQEGRYLMFDPDAQQQASAIGDDENEPAAGSPSADDNESSDTAGDTLPGVASQFYHATFLDRVVVRDTDRALLAGDAMDILFSLGTEAIDPASARPIERESRRPTRDRSERFNPTDRALPGPIPGMQLAQADSDTDSGVAIAAPLQLPPPFDHALIPQQNRDRSLYTAAPEDGITITWAGELRLVPLDAKPESLLDDEDIAITLRGDDAFAQSMQDGQTSRVEARELTYTLASETVIAAGGDGRPLAIVSPGAGTLNTTPVPGQPPTRMTVNLKDATATIVGPGTLTQAPDDEGKQLTLAWTDRVDFELYTEQRAPDDEQAEEDPGRPTGQTRVTGIRTATFVGEVTANHPDFDLAARQLAVGFDEPDEAAGIKNDPNRIQATEDVAVVARGDEADEVYNIETQSLTINIERDVDGEPYASSMRALADVRITQPGSVMTCHRLDVALAPPSESEAQTADADAADEAPADAQDARIAQVRQIVAVGDVRAQLDHDGRKVHLVADHLLGDVAADRLTLYATEEGTLAEVIDINEDRLLRGRHIVMDDQAQTVRVEGPGALAAAMEDPDRPGNPDARMTIGWQRTMRINSDTGKAEFSGQVEAVTRRSADTSDLTCDDLEVWFTLPEESIDNSELVNADDAALVVDSGEGEDVLLDAGGRDVRKAIATGNVRFVAATRADAQAREPLSRVMILGPKLTFTNEAVEIDGQLTPVETVVVDGEGTLFIQDKTDDDPEELAASEPDDNPDAVAFSGKGDTSFQWTDRMELDALGNTARFDGNVRMAHDPTPKDRDNFDDMHMTCARLIADMHDTGGLSVWMSDTAPQPEISTVTATGPLRIIRAGKEIIGDHLRYTAEAQWAEVWAEEGRDVILTERGRPAPVRAGRVLWDLANNRIEMRNARGGVAAPER